MARRAFVWGANGPGPPGFDALKYAAADADRIAAVLSSSPYDYAVSRPSSSVANKVLDELTNTLDACKKEDHVVVYFSGHGELLGTRLWLVLDTTVHEEKATYIRAEWVIDLLQDCKSLNKLLILDCCHAGAAGAKGPNVSVDELVHTKNHVSLFASEKLELARELESLKGSFLAVTIERFLLSAHETGPVTLTALSNHLVATADAHNRTATKHGEPKVPRPYVSGTLQPDYFFADPKPHKLVSTPPPSTREKRYLGLSFQEWLARLTSENATQRLDALRAMRDEWLKEHPERVVHAFANALSDKHASAAQEALRGLEQAHKEGIPITDAVVRMVDALEVDALRERVKRLLPAAGKTAVPLLVSRLDSSVGLAAADVLVDMRRDSVSPLVTHLGTRDEDFDRRLVDCIGRIGDDALPQVVALSSTNTRVAAQLPAIVSAVGASALPALEKALGNSSLRRVLLAALADNTTANGAFGPPLIALLPVVTDADELRLLARAIACHADDALFDDETIRRLSEVSDIVVHQRLARMNAKPVERPTTNDPVALQVRPPWMPLPPQQPKPPVGFGRALLRDIARAPKWISALLVLGIAAFVLGVAATCSATNEHAVDAGPQSAEAASNDSVAAAAPAVDTGATACPEDMVEMPEGTFTMAGKSTTVGRYCIDRYEVTVTDYELCRSKDHCRPPMSFDAQQDHNRYCNHGRAGFHQHPINCISAEDASTYCKFVGRRLPTEAEWEWAARGGAAGNRYPWGSTFEQAKVCSGADGTCEVGSHKAGVSPQGILDLAGNVAEITSTPSPAGDGFVLKGGNWRSSLSSFAVTERGMLPNSQFFNTAGVRCVKGL